MAAIRRPLLTTLGIAALMAPMALFWTLYALPERDPAIMAPMFHFYVVSFTALAAALACAVVIASAKTLQETRLLFLGLAFFAIAGIFATHGLTTPGFIVDEFYATVPVSAWFSIAAAGVLITASVVGLPPRLEHAIEARGKAVFAVATVAIALYIIVSLLIESWLDWVPIDDRTLQLTVGLSTLALLAFAAWRYYQAYVFARLPAQLVMVATLVLLAEVQTIILWGEVWHLSWWIYHALYAIAFGVLFAGWAMEVRRAGTLRSIADALSMRDALAQLGRGLDAPLVQLVDAIEVKDVATFGHVRRVSSHALAIGRKLGLSASELRSLVLAAEMHDVGKVSIPGSILTKPGPLTDEEFGVVKTHTVLGHGIAEKVPALRPLAEVIRCHHEHYDGTGYPDGRVGERIPLLARIIAVADTYDAITSKRPYREGASHEEAIAEILRVRGTQLDPQIVDIFLDVIGEGANAEGQARAA